jgi:2-methylisocitrate lyase-like PEP mutase family enzyme
MHQQTSFEIFRGLHERPRAFIMPNAWDGASAALLKRAGFEAIGSTSLAIAFALGRQDCAHAVSREEAIANAVLLARASGLPVNGDLEDGFGPDPDDCVATVEAAIEAGLAGVGIEDSTADRARPIHDFDRAVRRIEHAARAARGRILLTARADNFLHGRPDLEDTLRRLAAFAEAGADVLYAPALPDLEAIKAAVRTVAPKPLNVLIGPRAGPVPLDVLTEIGVRRVSLGGALYRRAMSTLVAAASALKEGELRAGLGGIPIDELMAALPQEQ